MVKTIEQLKAQGAEVKNATVVGENTATRVGTLFTDIVEHVEQYEAEQTEETKANADNIAKNAQAITDEVTRAKAAEGAIVYDVSAHNDGAVFESLSALLSSSNLDTLIPMSVRHGGMTIRFIKGSEQSSDNKYVQYRFLLSGSFTDAQFTNIANWYNDYTTVTQNTTTGHSDVNVGDKTYPVASIEDSIRSKYVYSELNGTTSFSPYLIHDTRFLEYGYQGHTSYCCSQRLTGNVTIPKLTLSGFVFYVYEYTSDSVGVLKYNQRTNEITIESEAGKFYIVNYRKLDGSAITSSEYTSLDAIVFSYTNNNPIVSRLQKAEKKGTDAQTTSQQIAPITNGNIFFDWVVGGIDNQGKDVTAPSKRRTPYLEIADNSIITYTVPVGYKVTIYQYSANKAFRSAFSLDARSETSPVVSTRKTAGTIYNRMMLENADGYDIDYANIQIKLDNGYFDQFSIKDIIVSANKFNKDTCSYNLRMASDGTTRTVSTFIVSDYINVSKVTSFNISNNIYSVVFFDSDKQYISGLTSVSAGKRQVVDGAYYIKVSCSADLISTLVIYFNQNVTTNTEFGFVPKTRMTGVDIRKDYATLEQKNSGEANLIDECSWTGQAGVAEKSYEYTKGYKHSIRLIGSNGINLLDLRLQPAQSIDVVGLCSVELEFYIPDITNFITAGLELIDTSFSRTFPLKQGWNKVYVDTFNGSISTWVSATRVRVYFSISGDAEVYLASIKLIKPDKARILVIDDHSYSSFFSIAYPRLKALGIPVTWALDCGRVGAVIGEDVGTILTQDEIDTLAYDYNSEFSMHGWTSEATTEMTPAEIKEDCHKCITYLKQHGIAPDYIWRAAWVQNLATNADAAYNILYGCATSTAAGGMVPIPVRKENRYSMPRMTIHGRTLAKMQSMFSDLKKTHGMLLIYTHGVTDEGGIHATNEEIDNFISCCTTAINEGWLEGTTFNKLVMEGLIEGVN